MPWRVLSGFSMWGRDSPPAFTFDKSHSMVQCANHRFHESRCPGIVAIARALRRKRVAHAVIPQFTSFIERWVGPVFLDHEFVVARAGRGPSHAGKSSLGPLPVLKHRPRRAVLNRRRRRLAAAEHANRVRGQEMRRLAPRSGNYFHRLYAVSHEKSGFSLRSSRTLGCGGTE